VCTIHVRPPSFIFSVFSVFEKEKEKLKRKRNKNKIEKNKKNKHKIKRNIKKEMDRALYPTWVCGAW
jgi:hypothetical protein